MGDVQIKSPEGNAVATISRLGATVVSFKDGKGIERFYRSAKEETISGGVLVGSILGGIPVDWPVFADTMMKEPGFEKVPFHGFAKGETWTHVAGKEGNKAVFTLDTNEHIKSMFAPDFKLVYTVIVESDQVLSVDLEVQNPSNSSTDLNYHLCYHTFFKIPEGCGPQDVKIANSLKGLSYVDKVDDYKVKTDSRDTFFYDGFTDSVYHDAPSTFEASIGPDQKVKIETQGLNTLTTWNPAKDLPESESGDWKSFVCIEPGHVKETVCLKPGQNWHGIKKMTFT